MPIVTQSRTIKGAKLGGVLKRYSPNGTLLSTATVNDSAWDGSQTTTSYRSDLTGAERRADSHESDSYSGERLSREIWEEYRRRFDTGHEFSTEKFLYESSFGREPRNELIIRIPITGGDRLVYTGAFQPVKGPESVYPVFTKPTKNEINLDGTRAIQATIPSTPEAGLTQFLGELKEGIPKLTGVIAMKKGVNGKSIAEEHLNREFGMKPFINDLTKFVNSMLSANKIVAQYRRDSGRNVRRRTILRDESIANVVAKDLGTLPYPSEIGGFNILIGTPVHSVVDTFHYRTWFSGAYTYHLAEMDSLFSKLDQYEQQANHLLGTRITPSTVWELTPWSWLIDWFSNFGQIVSNLTLLSQDSTVLRYGYIMHEIHAVRTHVVSGHRILNLAVPRPAPTVSSEAHHVSKTRTRATPYGFGINVSSLSPRRWAILSALGMTKGGNSLRLTD